MVKMEKTEKRYLLIVIAVLINAITISPPIPSQRWRLRRICWTTYGVWLVSIPITFGRKIAFYFLWPTEFWMRMNRENYGRNSKQWKKRSGWIFIIDSKNLLRSEARSSRILGLLSGILCAHHAILRRELDYVRLELTPHLGALSKLPAIFASESNLCMLSELLRSIVKLLFAHRWAEVVCSGVVFRLPFCGLLVYLHAADYV